MKNQLLLVIVLCTSLAPMRAGAGKLETRWQDDFLLETESGEFLLKIRGNVHLDTRLYQGDQRGAPHGIDIRRARMDLQGRIYQDFGYRVQAELAGEPYIRNAWVNYLARPWLQIRAGQMKVPFSSSWLTTDNNVNFVERGTSSPLYPFFDRGAKLWGEVWSGSLVYELGVYTGVGVDSDVKSGDIDDHQDLAARLFLNPFRSGLYLVAQATWGKQSTPSSRYETGGLRSANYASALWRWRSEQVLRTDGRTHDRIGAKIGERSRLGGELHYLRGPFACSAEYLQVRYVNVSIYHDLFVGSARKTHELIQRSDGFIRSLSVWASVYLTGESKRLTAGGWKTAKPARTIHQDGPGAWELLARYSRSWADQSLFAKTNVTAFAPDDSNNVSAAMLDGAHLAHELTLGLSWTLNPMVRLQLNNVFQWAPSQDRDGDGENDNWLISGAKSNQADPTLKNRKSAWENAIMLRLIFKL